MAGGMLRAAQTPLEVAVGLAACHCNALTAMHTHCMRR